jgi:DNA repair protein RadC
MRPLAYAPVEEFHVVLLDVRGRLLRTERIAQGSPTLSGSKIRTRQ